MDKQLRFLLAENNPNEASLVERELRKTDLLFSLERVETKTDFLKALRNHKPDIILADYSFASLNGLYVLERAQEKCPDIPFIFISETEGRDSAIESLSNGATDYVLKDHISRIGPVIRRALRELEERKQLKEAEKLLRHLAYYDSLTNLPNRLFFQERLVLELTHAKRNEGKLAVMLLDLDHFKEVNDVLGHSVGDKLLKVVGERLSRVVRRQDAIARFGGDEFVFVLPKIKQVEHVVQLVRRILRVFDESFLVDSHRLNISSSIGIALFPENGVDMDTLVKDADIAMYEVKRHGRNNYQFYGQAEIKDRRKGRETCKTEAGEIETAFFRENAWLKFLEQITKIAFNTLNLGKVFRQITEGLVNSLGYSISLIVTLDYEKEQFEARAFCVRGVFSSEMSRKLELSAKSISFPKNSRVNQIINSVIKGKAVVATGLEEIASPFISSKVCSTLQKFSQAEKHIVLPLKQGTTVVGALLVASPRRNFAREELRTLETVAYLAAEAIRSTAFYSEKVKLGENLRQSRKKTRKTWEGIVSTLIELVGARDPYTAAHQRRVADLSIAIAEEMRFSRDRIEGIRIAGLVHDIGKVGVPGEILSRPGPISESELTVIKEHSRTSYDVLKGLNFPWPVAEAAYQHHERLDGSGYPQGLSANKIILEARILGLADVVEAICCHRPYRPALGIDWALDEIRRNKGILYDPQVVDACIEVFTNKQFQFRKNLSKEIMHPME